MKKQQSVSVKADLKTQNELFSLMKNLFPICTSITGNGLRKTLKILKKQIDLKIIEVPTGSKVFDWKIPYEWNIADAYVKNLKGERIIDFKKFREIADNVNAYLMVDMAHFSGLVAGKGHPNPIEYADVVTSTTHKVLRGGRGGIILTNREDIIKKINSAVFPGYQGGPLMHIIAAKAVTFQEALQPSFKNYIKSVLANAKILSETLKNNGFKIYSGGTDTHLMLVDLRPFNVKGNLTAESLSRANITCNKNGIPFDSESPMITSGIRLGSQAATTRGFGLKEFQKVGELITKVVKGVSSNSNDNSKVENEVRKEVVELCSKFPIYNHLIKN